MKWVVLKCIYHSMYICEHSIAGQSVFGNTSKTRNSSKTFTEVDTLQIMRSRMTSSSTRAQSSSETKWIRWKSFTSTCSFYNTPAKRFWRVRSPIFVFAHYKLSILLNLGFMLVSMLTCHLHKTKCTYSYSKKSAVLDLKQCTLHIRNDHIVMIFHFFPGTVY